MDLRRKQFNRALKWAGLLFIGFLAVTQQVITNGPLIHLDAKIFNADRPALTSLERDRKSTRLNSSHTDISRMPSSA